jgi:hypothetical protein
MRVTRLTISSDRLRYMVADVTAPPLAQADCRRAPIVKVLDGGDVEIVDGYHRIAGMIAAGETAIDCITCDNTDLIALAADPGRPERQRRALAAIYRAI